MKRLTRPYRVSEAVVRGVAIEVFILSLLSLYSGKIFFTILLALDFAIRVFLIPRFSPLAFVSRKIIVTLLSFRKKQVVFKPKRFAAAIGFILSLGSLALSIGEMPRAAAIPLILLALFSFLEGIFRFCAGCKIFGLLIKLGLVSEDECPDCVYIDGSGI